MLVLNGKTLGERQKQLNEKVNEAALNNVNFARIQNELTQSDVDQLFAIDLASKYKNIEYIIQVLKSGDSLRISRALKCDWMFHDDFSHIINTDYLLENVFPYMSHKMIKKFLLTLSMNIRNTDRATAFCDYCMHMKFTNLALSFILFTSEAYKLEYMQKYPNMIAVLRNKNHFKNFIGNSFTMLEAYFDKLYTEPCKANAFKEFSNLYSLSDVKYLTMLEKHVPLGNAGTRLGFRISKNIMTRHKDRVLAKPTLYINFLHKTPIAKYSTPENVKTYLTALLPSHVNQFWTNNFCNTYEFILDVLPFEERFTFMKKIFNEKYQNKQFELTLTFYSHQYFRFMTTEQKEKMALDQISSKEEILGIGNDYKWYSFINFEKSFDAIKKLIIKAADRDDRQDMINVLIESAKTQRDLEKLFTYYYDRHNNELQEIKEDFVSRVANTHDIFEFDRNCWETFNKIYQNLDVYSMLNTNRDLNKFKVIALIYHIINKMHIHDALKLYIDNDVDIYAIKLQSARLLKEKQETVYQYLFHYYVDKINEFNYIQLDKNVKYKLRKYIHCVMDILYELDKTEQDIPDIVMKFIKSDWNKYSHHRIFSSCDEPKKFTQENIIRCLKSDAELAVGNLDLIRRHIEEKHVFPVERFLKKLKVYFSNDISKEYLQFYNELLTESEVTSRIARAACFGIFQLGEQSFNVDFMSKYAPAQSKVNRSEIDENLLNIQEAICATAHYSRPSIPLTNMLVYVKGDYIKKCLPMFYSYSASLPAPRCVEFVEELINNPVSVQKHGLRLAFTYFSAEDLRTLIFRIWRKTNNISIRLVIYQNLYTRIAGKVNRNARGRRRYTRFMRKRPNMLNSFPSLIVDDDQKTRFTLFEILRTLTLELRSDDDKNIFALFTSGGFPDYLKSDYMAAVWTTVNALPINKLNIQHKADVINYMSCNIQFMRQEIVKPIVETIVRYELNSKSSIETFVPSYINGRKWDLTANYVMYVPNKQDLDDKMELIKLIVNNCQDGFHIIHDNVYIVRAFYINFLRKLLRRSFSQNIATYGCLNVIFETILHAIECSSLNTHMYMIVWAIQLNLVARRALVEISPKCSVIENEVEKQSILRDEMVNFGRNVGFFNLSYKGRDMYLGSFMDDIRKELVDNIRCMHNLIGKFEQYVNEDYLLVVTCVGLMEFKNREAHLLALHILPTHYHGQYKEVYISVLNELKHVNDVEITCKIHEKFVNSDFAYRPYFQL